MANKALFWYNYKRFVDEGTIKPLSPKTFALSGLITVCGLVLSLTIYCLVFPNSFVGENTPIKLFFCTLFYMLGTLAMIGGDRKSTRLNSSHANESRMPSSA